MKLNYLVIGGEDIRRVKFFYEEDGKYGEFYIDFDRETLLKRDPDDTLGVDGTAELVGKDPDYADDLLQGLAKELREGFDEPEEDLDMLDALKQDQEENEATGN